MALKTGQGGEMRIVLRVQDDGTAVIEKFGDTSEKSADKASTAWNKAGIALGVAAAAAVTATVAMVKRAIDTADATVKMADKLGTSTEALSALTYAASLADVSAQELANSLQFMNRNLSDATKGTGEARFALKDLGLNAKELKDLKPEEAMFKIAQALEKIPNQADRAALAADIFNDRTGKMLNLLKDGPGAIRATMEEARRLGVVLGEESARAAERLKDNLTRLRAVASGLGLALAKDLTPPLLEASEAMVQFVANNGTGSKFVEGLGTSMKAVAHVAIGIAAAIEDIGLKIGAVASAAVDVAKLNFAEARRTMQLHAQDSEEINKRMLEAQARLWQELPAIATKANADAANASRGGDGTTRNSRQEEEDAKERERLEKEFLEIHRASVSEQIRLAEEYVEKYQKLNRHRAANVIRTDQALNDERLRLAEQYEAQLAELELKDPSLQASERAAAVLAAERATRQAALIARVEDLRGTIATENQTEADRYAQQVALLYEAWNTRVQIDEEGNIQRLLSDEEFARLREEIELKHQAKMGNIVAAAALARKRFDEMTAREKTQFVLNELDKMTQGVANSNKTMFQINKAANIANAIINTYLGVTQALKAYPPPLSIAMAAVQLAAGMAQVQQIKSAQFGSATSAPGVAGGGATPVFSADSVSGPNNFGPAQTLPPVLQAVPTRNVNLYIKSEGMLPASWVRDELIPQLNKAIGEGVILKAYAI